MSRSWRRTPVQSSHTSGSALARARVAAGLTQAQLAQKANVPKGTISWIESGRTARPRLGTASPLAIALGLTVADLWPPLAKAVAKGRLLDTVIPIEKAVRHRNTTHAHGMKLVYSDPDGGTRVQHSHRPPICCGSMWCRFVDLNDPETYRVLAEPTLIAAGGVNG